MADDQVVVSDLLLEVNVFRGIACAQRCADYGNGNGPTSVYVFAFRLDGRLDWEFVRAASPESLVRAVEAYCMAPLFDPIEMGA